MLFLALISSQNLSGMLLCSVGVCWAMNRGLRILSIVGYECIIGPADCNHYNGNLLGVGSSCVAPIMNDSKTISLFPE